MSKAKADTAVRIYPLPGAYIPGTPHIEQEVSPEEAKRLLAYQPPAYTQEAPQPPSSKSSADTQKAPPSAKADAKANKAKPQE